MATWKIYLVISVIMLFYVRIMQPKPHRCADSRNSIFNEGNFGEKAMFPWLGVLRVQLREGEKIKIAVTGVILVKERYVIANANDIVKLPQRIFKSSSKVMFIKNDADPWTCKPKDYMTHPEFEFATVNTIALIELELQEFESMPVLPVCWPPYKYNASNQLYALGYTDENQLLEKMGYKMQYVGRRDCDEFYNRSGFSDAKTMPTHFQCVFSPTNKKDCIFENGMAFVSNATGPWILIGIGIRGPGCAAPARFIDLNYYLPWVESSTTLEEEGVFRKSAFNEGFKPESTTIGIEDIPVHKLLRSGLRQTNPSDIMIFDEHREEFFYVDRFEPDAISVSFDTKYENKENDCYKSKRVVYKDDMRIVTNPERYVTASYRVSLFDLYFTDYNCVVIKAQCINRSPAHIWYTVAMELPVEFPKTPKQILRPLKHFEVTMKTETEDSTSKPKWKPHENLEVDHIDEKYYYRPYNSVHIFLKVQIKGTGVLTVAVYGPLGKLRPNSEKRPKTLRRKQGLRAKEVVKKQIDFINLTNTSSVEKHVPNIRSRSEFSKAYINIIYVFVSYLICFCLK